MSSERHLKQIDLKTLDSADRQMAVAKFRRIATALVIVLLLAGGGYAAYLMVSGDVVASRFAVNQMNCPACVITVKDVTTKIPGVVQADVSLAAQDVIVKYRDGQTNTDQIKQAIAHAGYPVEVDGMFKPSGSGIGAALIAQVNGKPVFDRDMKLSLSVSDPASKEPATAPAFFTAVGREILLQAADAVTVVIQPYEIDEEVQSVATKLGVSRESFLTEMSLKFGSKEKYIQTVGQSLGILKLRNEHVVEGIQNPEDKNRKIMEWITKVFREADVKILDPGVKAKIRAEAGDDDWKTFWPRMIGRDTELKSLLTQ